MKVALYVAELDVRGGTNKQVLKLFEFLKRSGVDVEIFTPFFDPDKTFDGFRNAEVNFISRSDAYNNRYIKFLYGCLCQIVLSFKMMGYQIVNVHDNRCLIVIIISKLLGKKVVWQINDIDPSFRIGNSKSSKTRAMVLKRFVVKFCAKISDAITVNVGKNRDRIAAIFGSKPELFYPGVEPLEYRENFIPDNNTLRIVSTGVVLKYRNYENLVYSANLLQKKYQKKVRLDIIGETKYDEAYTTMLTQLSSELNVETHIHGNVSSETLETIYLESDIFAFINIDQSWGLAIFEAASMGLPVLISDSVGACELLSGVEGVIVVDPNSPELIAKSIVENHDLIYSENVTRRLSEFVRNMTWDDLYSSRMLQLFHRIVF